jgi:hypothetical protein
MDKIRIRVSLNVDCCPFEIINAFQTRSTLDYESHR